MVIQLVISKPGLCRFGWMLFSMLAFHLVQIGNTHAESIVVDSMDALQAALIEENAGREILVLRGNYEAYVPLLVPDGVTLRGEGVMQGKSQPTGFVPGWETRIFATAGFAGDLVSLGDGAALEGLQLEQAWGSSGNVVMVGSRESGDSIAASIEECEIINPNRPGVAPQGPIGKGVVLITRNANAGAPPAPHEDAQISLKMYRSVIRSNFSGAGFYVINFGARGMITAELRQNQIVGELEVIGGASRGDAVSGAMVFINSEQNVYASPDIPSPGNGWLLFGGSSVPIPIPTSPSTGNAVYVSSTNDSIQGFTTSILAEGAHKFFDAPQQPVSDNLLDLRVRGLIMETAAVPGAADFRIYGAKSNGEFSPGDGNLVRVLVRNSMGSGYRENSYENTFGPTLEENMGVDNRIEFVGSSNAFQTTNDAIDPLPGEEFFSAGN